MMMDDLSSKCLVASGIDNDRQPREHEQADKKADSKAPSTEEEVIRLLEKISPSRGKLPTFS